MLDVTANPTAVTDLRRSLDAIRSDIDALVEARASLMTTACAELAAAGIDARVITRPGRTDTYFPGLVVWLTESWAYSQHRCWTNTLDTPRQPTFGPYADYGGLYIGHGRYEVLLTDGDDVLLAKIPGAEDEPSEHQRAVNRLRTAARAECMRVKVRGREVCVIDPINNIVHVGDVMSAFAWVLGIDVTDSCYQEIAA